MIERTDSPGTPAASASCRSSETETQRSKRAWIHLANAIIVLRRLVKEAWTRYRWDTRPAKQYRWR